MVKASAGGGGRGMRIVREPGALEAALRAARAEAESAFGDGRLLVERALLGARHVEIQVFGDEQGAIVHLGERDCSIQRRHQKLIEEAPSPAMAPELRAAMGAAAVKAARGGQLRRSRDRRVPSRRRRRFYFLEMNTRIQVEHPVTEWLRRRPACACSSRSRGGRPLPFDQSGVAFVAMRSRRGSTPRIPRPITCPRPDASPHGEPQNGRGCGSIAASRAARW